MIDARCGEVIVVDQCPRGPLPEDIQSTPGLVYLASDTPGMVRARNQALQIARGDIVIFLDDDVFPSKGLIAGHLSAYSDTRVGGVAGRIVEGNDLTEDVPDASVFDLVDGWQFARFDHRTRGAVMTARGCNMSFRRDLLRSLGGFDENIEIFRDDSDMCLRVIEAGYRIVFEPEAELIHLNCPSGGTRGTAVEATSSCSREWRSYRQYYRHYRDNLYFIIKHFRGRRRRRYLWQSYCSYVGFSRWPWRVLAKNYCFLTAWYRADSMYRQQPLPTTVSKSRDAFHS